jgi:voltage-dependent anion channel protein 2
MHFLCAPFVSSRDLEGKYIDGKNGLILTQTWLTNNALKTQLELEGYFTKGARLLHLT